MSIDVSPATEDEKPVVRRLMELNSHDFSEFDGRDLGPTGEYGYRYLDQYWIEDENRHPSIVRLNGTIAGCVLVRAGSPHRFGEFFIVRKHRRNGLGTKVARAIFSRFPGEWLVEESPGNDAAVAFWRRAIPVDFHEVASGSGTSQRFVSSAHRPGWIGE